MVPRLRLTSRRAASSLAAILVLVPAVATMTAASACSKTYGRDEPVIEEEAGPIEEAGPGPDTAVIPTKPFCEGSMAPLCDDFGGGASSKWVRRVSGSGTIDLETTEITSSPSSLRTKLTPVAGAGADPSFALIEQSLELSEETTYVYLNARVQTISVPGDQGGVRALRLDSRGLPAILVIADDTAFLATQDLMSISQLGKQFPWSSKVWHAISMQFTRVPGIGATVKLFVDGNLAAEGEISAFDSPYLVQIGPYRETSNLGADIIYDDVTLLSR
jgi:hypothetical protein